MKQDLVKDLLEGRLSQDDALAQLDYSQIESPSEAVSMRPPPDTGTATYTGEWTAAQAKHLLQRTTFGATKEKIQQSVANGMSWTIDKLLEELPAPSPPLAYTEQDIDVAIGDTWINTPVVRGNNAQYASRRRSMRSWHTGRLLSGEFNLREKMTLFWHNHFAVEDVVVIDARFQYTYLKTLRDNCFGNFRELCKSITVDAMMLRYLNGRQNRAGSPNENYARELLELFSIGKGPQVADGDYTNYTEEDVREMARVLTGWRDVGYLSETPGEEVSSRFIRNRHDRESKTLSHRFDNVTIENMDELEYAHAIDIIFAKKECARFICRKLYRWFVYYEITDVEEMQVIEPMADALVAADYEIESVLRILLQSEHFYDPLNCGCMIKSPIDFVNNLLTQLDVSIDGTIQQTYTTWFRIYQYTATIQQQIFQPPNVAGWAPYYQAPGYYRLWTNSVTLPMRIQYTDLMTLIGFRVLGLTIQIDFLDHISRYDNPTDPNDLIDEAIALHCPKDFTEEQKTFLKSALLPGLPDFEWTVEYGEYLGNPSDEGLSRAVHTKLRLFFRTLMLHPEYHLS